MQERDNIYRSITS